MRIETAALRFPALPPRRLLFARKCIYRNNLQENKYKKWQKIVHIKRQICIVDFLLTKVIIHHEQNHEIVKYVLEKIFCSINLDKIRGKRMLKFVYWPFELQTN